MNTESQQQIARGLQHAISVCKCKNLSFKNAGYRAACDDITISLEAALSRLEEGGEMESISVVQAAQTSSEQQDDSPHWTQANEGESETSTQDKCIEAIVKWVVADTKATFPTITAYDDTCLRKEVSFQVNAALTAERQRREQANEALKARDAFAKRLERQNKELNDRLLSALAAIEWHNGNACCDSYINDVDLSLLHERDEKVRAEALAAKRIEVYLTAMKDHDAEVRKPLVDALTTIAEYCEAEGTSLALSVAKTARNALAKVKQ